MGKKKNRVYGKYALDELSDKERKALKRKKEEEAYRKECKTMKRRCDCNHIDADNGKIRLTDDNNNPDFKVCKICGGRVYKDDEYINPDYIQNAFDVIYSAFSCVRMYLPKVVKPNDVLDKKITQALMTISYLPKLMEKVEERFNAPEDIDFDKKKKKKKKDKKNKHKYERVRY